MRTLLVLSSLALSSSVLLTGCPLACGGFDGGGDVVYQRGADMAIVCSNGGFTATLGDTSVEGRYDGTDVTVGATGAVAFDFTRTGDTASSKRVGEGWQRTLLDEVGLDHADVMCQDLTARTWWETPTGRLPVATTFTKVAEGWKSVAQCEAATLGKSACEDQMVLCPDGSLTLRAGELDVTGTYTAEAGQIGVVTDTWGFAGTYTSDGTLVTPGLIGTQAVTWSTAAPMFQGRISPALACH